MSVFFYLISERNLPDIFGLTLMDSLELQYLQNLQVLQGPIPHNCNDFKHFYVILVGQFLGGYPNLCSVTSSKALVEIFQPTRGHVGIGGQIPDWGGFLAAFLDGTARWMGSPGGVAEYSAES